MADDELTLNMDDFAKNILEPAMAAMIPHVDEAMEREILGPWRFWLLRLSLRLPEPVRSWALMKLLKHG